MKLAFQSKSGSSKNTKRTMSRGKSVSTQNEGKVKSNKDVALKIIEIIFDFLSYENIFIDAIKKYKAQKIINISVI